MQRNFFPQDGEEWDEETERLKATGMSTLWIKDPRDGTVTGDNEGSGLMLI